ncbi:hypothetical protein LX97_02917 [Nonlabens dokdonensis]|jgi:hypothetical protein|uniref:Uncharacterized protein n=2 Tax=Nonlabens dokdonensis TaxID=328515 RepID=L7W9C6_NONDD|nr:hypothetical protein [Nonlabens dokdonensis]AGC78290.1 hypothetical protein DDD_3163 [Nonlabens dokdonensis DSW-6]PZX37822.1 hypothetical protein LX97_02917 [Nonlabens dokdonensis]
MKSIVFTLISCLTLSIGFAQVFNTQSSSYFEKESEKDTYSIHFPSAYGFTVLHHLDNVMMDNNKSMVLTKYDQSMKDGEKISFNLPKLGLRASDLEEVIEVGDQLIFLSTVMHKKQAKHNVNAQVYSNKSSSVSENKILASFPIKKYSKSGFYSIAISSDKTKFAIVANMPFVKKTKEKVMIWVYDMQLNLLWEQSETLPFDSSRSYDEDVFLQNSGVVLINKTIDASKKRRANKLLAFNGENLETIDFSKDGFLPMELQLINVNGTPMLTGFFWNGKSSVIRINSKEGSDNDGAFLYDVNTNTLIGIHEWSDTLDKSDLKSLKVVDVEVKGDDIYLIGEKYLYDHEFRKTGNKMSTELDYLYTYGSSILVNFDSKGSLKGFTPLFKSKQYKNGAKEQGSMTALILENGLRVFSNNDNYITMSSFYGGNDVTFNRPSIIPFDHGTSTTPLILPRSVKAVDDYAMVYYITNYGDRYWFNKMTW